ncbi:MAG: hypothetical protein HYW47_06090 [Deltaproteobacteria bacterium]|nr:hypothetical protein [Deltaproteobacteria bacterium]
MNNLGSELGHTQPILSWIRVIASVAKQSPRIALAILGQHLRVEIATGSLRTLAMTARPFLHMVTNN